MIYTFYSYKGGVGRSMALANIGEYFYQNGKRVLLVDWDLEAPGLERYFPIKYEEILKKRGVINILNDYKERMTKSVDHEEKLFPDLEDYLCEIYPETKEGGKLLLLTAGKRDGDYFSSYAQEVRRFDWKGFYTDWAGEQFFEWMRNQFNAVADVILIDSRTGVTEMGGVCTYQFADIIILFCAPNQQNLDGTKKMVERFVADTTAELRGNRPLDVVVIPSRVEDRAEARLLSEFRILFNEAFVQYQPGLQDNISISFWDLKIPHVPFYSFNENVAVRNRILSQSDDIVRAYESIALTLENLGKARGMLKVSPKRVDEVKQDNATLEGNRDQFSIVTKIRPHAFVIMPFGKKKGADGSIYDFNEIYKDLVKPALELAGFEPFRADEETTSGDILTDMFQELLLADMVVMDLSIDNANTYYELGIRHAFRKRGIVHIQAGRSYMPFDIFNVRTLPYHLTSEGVVDPGSLESDLQALARISRDTWASDRDAVHSPIYNLLTGLNEPQRSTLRTPLATGFWREYNEWNQRVAVAERQNRAGDIALLTEEIRNPLIKEEAISRAGNIFMNLRQYELGLMFYRQGLELNPENRKFRLEEALHLNRLGRVDESIIKLESILSDAPNDIDAMVTLARIYKEMWNVSWESIKIKAKRIQAAYESYHWLIKSIEIYLKGYFADLKAYTLGINALVLATILKHLVKQRGKNQDVDPDVATILKILPKLQSTLELTLENVIKNDMVDYWALTAFAELLVLTSNSQPEVIRAYRKSITAGLRNFSYLQSSLAQLNMLASLNLRPEYVEAGRKVLKEEIKRNTHNSFEEGDASPKQKREQKIFLFAGQNPANDGNPLHSISPTIEDITRGEILKTLKGCGASEGDLAITAGAAYGSDIIFIETCLDLGLKVEVYIPLAEAPYIREKVSPAGDEWVERFYRMRSHPLLEIRYQAENLGHPKAGDNLFERNNLWALYSSLVYGIDRVRLIALWDGNTNPVDGRGDKLVYHMVDLMRDIGGVVEQINTAKLESWQAS